MRPIDDDLIVLGHAGVAKQRWVNVDQRAAHPDVEEIGKVGVGHGVVIRGVGHKCHRGVIRERVGGRGSTFNMARMRFTDDV